MKIWKINNKTDNWIVLYQFSKLVMISFFKFYFELIQMDADSFHIGLSDEIDLICQKQCEMSM